MEKNPNYYPKTPPNREISSKSCADSFLSWYNQNQWWYQIDLDELYRLHSSFFSADPSFKEKNPKLLFKNQKNLCRFVPELVPTKPMVVPDRSRGALSIALLIFFRKPLLHGENPKLLFKTSKIYAYSFPSWYHTVKKIRILGNLCYYQKPFLGSRQFGNSFKGFPNDLETQKGFQIVTNTYFFYSVPSI
jgi:hypothetical protein